MESKVSKRLKQPLSDVVIKNIFAPRLNWEFFQNFELLNQVNFAHLVMLSDQKILESSKCVRLAQALLSMQKNGPDAVELDAAREEAYFNYEAHLIKLVGADLGGRLHTGRSRNDMRATFDRIRAREFALRIGQSLSELTQLALRRSEELVDCVMTGYTHMQAAQPISLGYYFSGLANAWTRDLDRILHVLESTDGCPLGACALAGTSFPIDRSTTSELLGFTQPIGSALDSVASRDFLLELSSSVAIMGTNFSRMAQDFYIWSTPEYGFISFPDSVASTSSIMPQKKNPVVLEFIRGKTGHLIGLTSSALATIKSTHFTHAGDTGREISRICWEGCEEALRLLELMKLLVSTVEPDRARMLVRTSEDFSTVTDLADLLVRDNDLSFREAHHVIGAVVRVALDSGVPAHQITSEMIGAALAEQTGKQLSISEASISACLDPLQNISSRSSYGGPAPKTVLEQVARQVKAVEGKTKAFAEAARRISEANGRLDARIHALAETTIAA